MVGLATARRCQHRAPGAIRRPGSAGEGGRGGHGPRGGTGAYGAAEGLTEWEAYDRWPWGDYPGLELRQHVAIRGMRTMKLLADQHPDSAVIVVSHGGVIRAILDVVHHRRSPRILNAAVSTMSFDGERWLVHSINGVDTEV